MVRVVVSEPADEDMSQILAHIAREAGIGTATKYRHRFERLFDLIAQRPDLCAARPSLGPFVRAGVVYHYLAIYRYVSGQDTLSVLRVLHGRRNISQDILT